MSNFNLHFSTVGMKAKNIYITISLSLAVSAGLHAEHWAYLKPITTQFRTIYWFAVMTIITYQQIIIEHIYVVTIFKFNLSFFKGEF